MRWPKLVASEMVSIEISSAVLLAGRSRDNLFFSQRSSPTISTDKIQDDGVATGYLVGIIFSSSNPLVVFCL